jgi:hypothetical protein
LPQEPEGNKLADFEPVIVDDVFDEDFETVGEAVPVDGMDEVGLTQEPLTQIFFASHRFSQEPQFFGSLLVSAQTPSHSFSAELVLYGPHV